MDEVRGRLRDQEQERAAEKDTQPRAISLKRRRSHGAIQRLLHCATAAPEGQDGGGWRQGGGQGAPSLPPRFSPCHLAVTRPSRTGQDRGTLVASRGFVPTWFWSCSVLLRRLPFGTTSTRRRCSPRRASRGPVPTRRR